MIVIDSYMVIISRTIIQSKCHFIRQDVCILLKVAFLIGIKPRKKVVGFDSHEENLRVGIRKKKQKKTVLPLLLLHHNLSD